MHFFPSQFFIFCIIQSNSKDLGTCMEKDWNLYLLIFINFFYYIYIYIYKYKHIYIFLLY